MKEKVSVCECVCECVCSKSYETKKQGSGSECHLEIESGVWERKPIRLCWHSLMDS